MKMNEHFGLLLKNELVCLKEHTELQLKCTQSNGSRETASDSSDSHVLGDMQDLEIQVTPWQYME